MYKVRSSSLTDMVVCFYRFLNVKNMGAHRSKLEALSESWFSHSNIDVLFTMQTLYYLSLLYMGIGSVRSGFNALL